jgi:hypothetical protein
MIYQVFSGWVRLCQVTSGYDRLSQVKSGCQVSSGEVGLIYVMSGYVR